jgi:starch synthase
MNKRSRFVIATTGRFHVLDLARELIRLGYNVKFFSVIPVKRALTFGLPKENVRSLFWFTFPFLFLERLFKGKKRQQLQRITALYCDFLISQMLPDCDFFIGMSGLFPKSRANAKKKFNATTICERGSTHVKHQLEVLKSLHTREISLNQTVEAELLDYKQYDKISIPSEQVAITFRDRGVKDTKLLINPYGVDLSCFKIILGEKKTNTPSKGLVVGRWGLRKGADLILKLLEVTDIKITHIGPVDDVSIACRNPKFLTLGVVDQLQLVNYYNDADFLILLSREEGLALVQIQALACGIPVLCSQFTGGRDLKRMIERPDAIVEVDIYDFNSILAGLKRVCHISNKTKGLDLIGEKGRNNLSWKSYAERYVNLLT